MGHEFEIEEKIPSKKNQYEIRFSRSFWSYIRQMPLGRERKHYWIGPSKEVKQAEQLIGWVAASKIPHKLEGNIKLTVEVKGRGDLDNYLGVILDGLEKSGRIDNDRQVAELTIRRVKGKKGCKVTVEEL